MCEVEWGWVGLSCIDRVHVFCPLCPLLSESLHNIRMNFVLQLTKKKCPVCLKMNKECRVRNEQLVCSSIVSLHSCSLLIHYELCHSMLLSERSGRWEMTFLHCDDVNCLSSVFFFLST